MLDKPFLSYEGKASTTFLRIICYTSNSTTYESRHFVIAPGIEARAQAGKWRLICHAQSKAISGYGRERVHCAKKGRKVASLGRYKTVYAHQNCLYISLSNDRTEQNKEMYVVPTIAMKIDFTSLLLASWLWPSSWTVDEYEGEALCV